MCGIVGVFNPFSRISETRLSLANKALIHRGPDGDGIWISKNGSAGLGHRRLAIIDPEEGVQPLISADGNIAASVNGEFYGYKKIKKDLQNKGYVFKTRSDSEILLYLYQEYGLKLFNHLRGEFAFVLYDQKRNQLVAGRDRFGIKPLQYYLGADKTIYVASEAKAIFAAGVRAEWDLYALYHSFSLQYLPQDRTVFRGVYQLKPGHVLVYKDSGLKIKKYWDLDLPTEAEEKKKKYDEAGVIRELENLLKESVSVRLQTDGAKYCAQVSGGIDSAIIAALAAQTGKQRMHCFTVAFPHDLYDESAKAKKLAKYIGADFTPILVDSSDIVDVISDASYYSEGMAINSHISAKFILNREIKKAGYKIALTGEGADESFAGYIHLKKDLLGDIPVAASHGEQVAMGVHLASGESIDLGRIKKSLGYLPAFLEAKGSIGHTLHSLFTPQFKEIYSVGKITSDFVSSLDIIKQLKKRSRVNQSSYLWTKFALANSILKTLGDGCEMANSIEGRVPFLDHKVFEFVKNIPISLKIKGEVQKYVLREMAKKYVPKEIYEQPKQPFMAPPLSLLKDKTGMRFLMDCFTSQEFKEMGFFDQNKVLKLARNLDKMEMKKQIALEPVVMLMASALLIKKNFNLPSF